MNVLTWLTNLPEPLKIGLLRQMAERMGALERYNQRQTEASELAVNHLADIHQLLGQIAAANGKPSPAQLTMKMFTRGFVCVS